MQYVGKYFKIYDFLPYWKVFFEETPSVKIQFFKIIKITFSKDIFTLNLFFYNVYYW